MWMSVDLQTGFHMPLDHHANCFVHVASDIHFQALCMGHASLAADCRHKPLRRVRILPALTILQSAPDLGLTFSGKKRKGPRQTIRDVRESSIKAM